MGTCQSLPEQVRTFDVNVNMLTTRGPSIPDGAPFTFAETDEIMRAYEKFLASDKTVYLICLSGNQFPVHYNLDGTRPIGDRLLICWDLLAPMFCGPPTSTKSWANLPTIVNFIAQNIHLERCNVLATDTCSCSVNRHTVVEPGLECENKVHWHHFCAGHVAAWLTEYLVPAILLKESKERFDDYIAIVHRKNTHILEYYATEDRRDRDIMLESVRNVIDWVFIPPLSI